MKSNLLLSLLSLLFTLSLSINQEGLQLLEAKKALKDPSNYLSDWNSKDTTPCNWKGITCTSTSVTSIDLFNLGLKGPFPYTFCNLTKLSFLNLQLNYINDSLDDPSISHCTSLTHIDLSSNELVGPLPSSLAHLPFLEYLDLSANNFSGEIPASFGLFPKLKVLSLTNNLLTSTVPDFLGNVSSLTQLNLSYNLFSPSSIPPSFGNLSSLQQLWLSGCSLIGPIPETLGKLSKLQNFDVSTNNLTGSVPESVTKMSSLVQLELYDNNLSGLFPNGFSKITSLLRLDASNNNFEGFIPDDLFDVTTLQSLRLSSNRFSGEISPNVAKMKSLFELVLFDNQLSGSLPSDLGKNSPLVSIDLSYNNFTGEIPSSLCSSGKLENLLLIKNSFSGSIPNEIGECKSLHRVRLWNNKLSGNVPDGLWGLPHVGLLELSGNSLSGEISALILTASNLSNLIISDNEFTGSIPPEIGSLHKLYEISAANNKLSGPLPSSLTNLDQLGVLDLHGNFLSGEFTSGTGKMKKLTELNLADNDFSGTIPSELGDLPVLNYLDLSGNRFSGKLPSQLQNLKLNKFNMSNNQLNGPLPPMFINTNYRTSFLNNPGLCGDLPDLCSGLKGDFHKNFTWIFKAIFVIASLMLVAGIGWFYVRYLKFKKSKMNDKSKWTLTSFHKLGFSEYEILDCLDEDNVIGTGASGKVYKATLSSGNVVAVKKLWNTSKVVDRFGDDAFDAEVTTLGKIRHKNIVKLWCSCSHKDCKMLVYEYMPNGSLGDLLHSNKGSMLDWPMRYKIALDAAEGLSYLHHGCVPPIVHRDVKSNNILLDSDFGAKVADFGVAKAVDAIGKGAKSMSVIAGSCGYIAPEYAYTLRVNEKSDIYSFGVVILELVTGRLPLDPEFGEKDLMRWVCSTIEQKGVEHVFDPNLDLTLFKEEINQVLNIGLQCTSNLPMNRPSMRRVVKMLLELVPDVDDKSKEKDGKQSPYYYEDTSSYQENIV